MSEKIGSIQIWIGIIDKTQEAIQAQQEAATKEIREIFWALANSVKSFSEEGNLDEVSNLLKELESAKEKINWELENLLKQIQSEAGQAGEELQNLVTNLGEQQGDSTEQQGDSTRLIASPTEKKENFETTEDKKNKEKALNFIQTMITNQDTFESIKKKINEIKYTEGGIKIGPVQWKKNNYQNFYQIASKEDFERSFEWLFGEKLPPATKTARGNPEYPRDRRIAVIPLLLGWEKEGRLGQDWKQHLQWKAGFYVFQGERVCKFDKTGGTIRPKREADGHIKNAYITQ